MESWDDIREWRRSVRSQHRLKRSAFPSGDKETVRLTVYDLMREHFPELRFACLGFYWPFQGEIDVRHLVRNFLALGAEAALPVVVEARGRLQTIYPQPHDRPMDAIVTESGVVRFRHRDGPLGDAVRSSKSPQRTGG
jgi:5-formyltetrahydrofolate cyclo-ligase